MIARLVGHLVAREGTRGILDVRGVGYAVHATERDLDQWDLATEAAEVFVSTDVREDAITLFGFSTDLGRRVFERLRQVNGVGPKVALAALETHSVDKLAQAVEAEDVAALSRIPGVGKKLAARMALELKGKLPTGEGFVAAVATAGASGQDTLALALSRLGYNKTEIARAQTRLAADGVGPDSPVSDRLRKSLQILSGA